MLKPICCRFANFYSRKSSCKVLSGNVTEKNMHGTRKLLQRQDASTSNKNRPRTPRNLAKRGVLQAAELPALSSTALT